MILYLVQNWSQFPTALVQCTLHYLHCGLSFLSKLKDCFTIYHFHVIIHLRWKIHASCLLNSTLSSIHCKPTLVSIRIMFLYKEGHHMLYLSYLNMLYPALYSERVHKLMSIIYIFPHIFRCESLSSPSLESMIMKHSYDKFIQILFLENPISPMKR